MAHTTQHNTGGEGRAAGGLTATMAGSPLFMAPEVHAVHSTALQRLLHPHMSNPGGRYAYDGRADLWSVGLILFTMLTKQTWLDVYAPSIATQVRYATLRYVRVARL